jgi:rabenosyn-5
MSEFREGFLCPICMSDLGDDIQLVVHFDEKHAREDPAIVQNLKDLFGKYKKKITPLKLESATAADNLVLETQNNVLAKQFYGCEPSNYHPVSGIHYDLALPDDNKIDMVDNFDTFR